MKLELKAEAGAVILLAQGDISTHELQVLRAGVMKILKTGKNRIIIELQGAQDLSSDVLREISALDLVARELSGRILLAGANGELKKKIELFATPPVIPCFENRAAALAYFAELAKGKPEIDTAPKPPPAVAQVAPPPATPTPEEAKKSKDSALQQEKGELGTLREKLAAAQAENKTFKEQLQALLISRTMLPDDAAYRDKIKSLEADVERLMGEVKVLKEGKKASG